MKNQLKPSKTLKTTKNEPRGPRKAFAKTWLKRFQKTIILGFAATVLYEDLIKGLNFKLVLGSRAPAGAILYPKRMREPSQKRKPFFFKVHDSLREVGCSTTFFLLFYVFFVCILAYFGLPDIYTVCGPLRSQGSYNGKKRNAGCMLGK